MDAKPAIRINVDPSNPGQFFACCGILELADRLWPGAEGWFEAGEFRLCCRGTLIDVLHALVIHIPEAITNLNGGLNVKPLIAPLRLTLDNDRSLTITLDAWMTIDIKNGTVAAVANPPWNFWSGQQTSFRIWRDLRSEMSKQLTQLRSETMNDLFAHRVMLSGRFGFDPGAAWNALDVGFSPNEQNMDVESSAAVELLAAVGIQRFQPSMAIDRQSFTYSTWSRPLSPPVAMCAACGVITVGQRTAFLCRVASRGSYAALAHSTIVRR